MQHLKKKRHHSSQPERLGTSLHKNKNKKLNKLLICLILMELVHSLFILGQIDSKELKVAMRALGFEPKKE